MSVLSEFLDEDLMQNAEDNYEKLTNRISISKVETFEKIKFDNCDKIENNFLLNNNRFFSATIKSLDFAKGFGDYLNLLKATLNIVRFEDKEKTATTLRDSIFHAVFDFIYPQPYVAVLNDLEMLIEVDRLLITLYEQAPSRYNLAPFDSSIREYQ